MPAQKLLALLCAAVLAAVAVLAGALPGQAAAKHRVSGAIGTYYRAHAKATGPATGSQKKLRKPAGAYQNFRRGKVYWSKRTGAHFVTGTVGRAYRKARSERGRLGYPASDARTSKAVTTQRFQGGSIRVVRGKASVVYPAKPKPKPKPTPPPKPTSPAPTPKPTSPTPTRTDVRVASYNIGCDKCSEGRAWFGRAAAVTAIIKKQFPDALGVQEASQGWLRDANGKPYNRSQFEDLGARLASSGYRITNAKRNNCVKDTTPTDCVPRDRGASKGTRIFYNANTTQLVRSGALKLEDSGTENERYFAWAVLTHRATGKQYFFGTTHLSPKQSNALHATQARQIVAEVAKRNTGRLPVIVNGDFNSSNFQGEDGYNAAVHAFAGAGYDDFLAHAFGHWAVTAGTPADRINADFPSFNDYNPQVRLAPRNGLGSTIDWMVGSSAVTVKQWETVVDVKSREGTTAVLGSTPSDHHMIRATVSLG